MRRHSCTGCVLSALVVRIQWGRGTPEHCQQLLAALQGFQPVQLIRSALCQKIHGILQGAWLRTGAFLAAVRVLVPLMKTVQSILPGGFMALLFSPTASKGPQAQKAMHPSEETMAGDNRHR
jgi:hypothetical protein